MDTTKYVAEFIGTFAFVLAIFLIVEYIGAKNPIAVAVSIGAVLAALIWTAITFGGDGHFNPAFTVAKLTSDYNTPGQLVHYIAFLGAQVAAALSAYYVYDAIKRR